MIERIVALTVLLSAVGLADGRDVDWGDLSAYSITDHVWLGSFGGEVEVDPVSDLVAQRYGDLEWLVDDGKTVEKGDAVAVQSAGKVRQSLSELLLSEEHLEIKLKSAAWSQAEKTTALKRQMEEIESKVDSLELTKDERKLIGSDLAARLMERREQLQIELDIVREKLDPKIRDAQLKFELEQLKNEFVRAKLDHDELVYSMSVFAPHSGIARHQMTGTVRPDDVIGTVQQSGRAVVKLKIVDPEIRSEQPERLVISVMDTKGRRVMGDFSRVERLAKIGLGSQIHHFTLVAEDDQKLDPELSGERMVTIYRRLDRKAHIVKKSTFLFAEPEKIQRLGWAAYIKTIWPKSEVVYVGPSSIAVSKSP